MAQLYITSPINNDTLYRPVTVETNTANTLADSIDNHHATTQVIIADSTDAKVLIADKNNAEVIIADKNDAEVIIADKNGAGMIVSENASAPAVEKTAPVVIATDKAAPKPIATEKNENKKSDVGRVKSIEVVKTVSVPSGIPVKPKETAHNENNSTDKIKSPEQLPLEVIPDISNSIKKSEVSDSKSAETTESKLSETTEQLRVKLPGNPEDGPVKVCVVPDSTPDSAAKSDALTAAAEKVNAVLLSETNSLNDPLKSEIANDVKKTEIVIIPDESPTPTKHQPHLSSQNPIQQLSAPSQVPTIQPHTSANKPPATIQNLNQPIITRSDATPPVLIADSINPAAQTMTSQQQSIIQKLIPSLINLNKSVNSPTALPNLLQSATSNSVTPSPAPPAAPVPSLIPAVSNRTGFAGISGGGVGLGGSIGGSGDSGGSVKSNGVITIDDDDDLVVTQVIKPAAGSAPVPAAPAPSPAPSSSRNDSLLQLVSKIKSMVEPNAASQPKLKQLQQTLASLIKSQGLSRNAAGSTPQQHQQQISTAAASTQQRVNYQQQLQQTSTTTPRTGFQHQGVIQNVSTPQRKVTQPQQIPQRQLQALLQQAIANRTQAQQQAVQQHASLPRSHSAQQLQQKQMRATASSSSAGMSGVAGMPGAAGISGASQNVLQQLLQAVMSKQPQHQQQHQQQQQQQQQQILKQQYLPQKPLATATSSQINHATQNQNQHLMLIENALKGTNPNLAANLKTLQDQLKAKSSNPADIKNELTAIISNVLRLRNSQQQMDNTSPKPLKSPSLRRQIQTAHRPKLNTASHHVTSNKPGPSHIQQLRKPVRAPTIDLLQNLPVVHHSKEKVQFLGVVGLITRQEHQRLIISHANRKRRIEEARNILQLEKVSFERKRKRPRKDDMENDGDTHDNYCGKCRMAGELLMCDKCPRVYHLFCLDPPLKQVPDGEWFCSKCQEEKDAEESMDVNVIDVMEDPAVDQESREQIEELHRKLMEAKRVRLDLENTTDVT